MFFNILIIISWCFGIMGIFFVITSTNGFIKNTNFYIKLHCLYLINLYGVNFILFGVGINSCDSTIFFKTIFMIILNILSTLTVGHCFMRKVFLTGVEFNCKERTEMEEEIIQEKQSLIEREAEKQEQEKLKKEKEAEAKKLEEIKRKEVEAEEAKKTELLEKERKKEEKAKKKAEEDAKYEAERNDLQEKIKEQKRKLKDKIDKARKNAKITRKQSEIDKTEDMIKDILDKYGLTEDMLTE